MDGIAGVCRLVSRLDSLSVLCVKSKTTNGTMHTMLHTVQVYAYFVRKKKKKKKKSEF